MEKYIIIFQDGQHYTSNKITENDTEALLDGIISIVRFSDTKELLPSGEWKELPEWKN